VTWQARFAWATIRGAMVTRKRGRPTRYAIRRGIGLRRAALAGFGGRAGEVLEAIVDAFCAVDANWRIVYVNRRAAALWQLPIQALVGRNLWESLPRPANAAAERQLRRAAAGGAVEFETISVLTRRWVQMRVSPMSGGLVGVYWRDIHEQKRAVAALRRNSDDLRLAMEAAGFGLWDYDIVTGERNWTDQAKALMGVPLDTRASYDAFIAAAHPDDRERIAAAHRRAQDPAGGGQYEVEYRVAGTGPDPRWVAARGRALFDETGRPVRMIGVSLDITEHKQRETALRDSEERFRAMLEALPQIAFVIRTDGIAQYYNRHFTDYVGHPIGLDPASRTALQHPDDQAALAKARLEGVLNDREYTVEARVRRRDGAYRWHVIRNAPLKRGGKTVAWLGTAIDIDDMRQAQETLRRVNDELERRVAERTRDLAEANERLRKSEESFGALFRKAPVPMHSLDALRRIVDVNERWLELFGYTRDEVVGRRMAEFHASSDPALHDARWKELVEHGALREVERKFVKKSGEIFDALVSAYLERDAEGNFRRTITTTIDVTARRRAEEAVRRERQLSELLIECGTEAIVGFDKTMRYIAWNPAMEAMSGISRQQLLGRTFYEMRPDLVGTPIETAWQATMEGRRTTLRDRPYKFAPPGRSGYYDADFAPLYAPDRSIIGGFAFLRDTTDRRRIEEQLRQSQKMEAVGQLTGGVAHDFNNLLTIIMGNLDNLQHYLPENPEARRMADAIMRAAGRAATLTQRLLAFARRQPLEPKAIEVNRLVGGMSDLLRRSLGEGIVIETVLAGGLWRTLADPNQLESALLNLAVNARDAMPLGGKLTIETANAYLDESYAEAHEDVRPGQYVLIAVSDTGSGMSREVAEKAFEPFFTTKDVGQGTGLGLPQVYGFVKQSEGHVKIYSEPGEGTTVKLYLPRLIAAEATDETKVEPSPPPATAPGETVLIVEDDDDVRGYSAEILRGLGYRVLEASEGHSALRMIDAEPEIHLLFTDVGLPGGLNGRQLADEARRRRPDLKVLFTTGYARNAIVHQGRLDPGVELLVKPFTAQALGAKVRRLLARR
jgi:PAS domain S-box-containing protein